MLRYFWTTLYIVYTHTLLYLRSQQNCLLPKKPLKCTHLTGCPQQLHALYMFQGTIQECLLNSLDILTFVVPPILPAALTANNAFAQKRLQKEGIFCLHSKHICLCGGIDIVAFDKVSNLYCIYCIY